MDDFNAYRAMCANRLRRLERCKKARSFCNLDDETPSSNHDNSNTVSDFLPTSAPPFCQDEANSSDRFFVSELEGKENSAYELIKEQMFMLMENDMSLLKQLITLGDKITEMKETNMRKCQSQTSIDDRDDEELEDQFDDRFSASMSAVTTLYVDDAQPQYFSRQNSVLRIPIPPRSSNRFGARRIPRRPSDALRTVPSRNLRINSDDATPESSNGLQSPCDCSLNYSASAMPSKKAVGYSSSSVSTASTPSIVIMKNRSSNSSIDSGIRESSSSTSPSPTFDKEVV